MLLKTYFERLYPYILDDIYHPSRKNYGVMVLHILSSAGSKIEKFQKGKKYTSEDVPLERKLYDGSRELSVELKSSFSPFDIDGLTSFYEKNINDDQVGNVAAAFSISPSPNISKTRLCKSLALQLKAFVDSNDENAADIVLIEYQEMIAEPQETQAEAESHQPVSALYPNDNFYPRSKYRPIYDVRTYEKFTHTWSFENTGEHTWRGRRLFFSNHDTVRPRASAIYIDIPVTLPHKGVVLTIEMDARGFEEKSECKWIMVDSENNDCFPNSGFFSFVVNTRFDYK